MSKVVDKELSFEQQQKVAFEFLNTFYTRKDLGYSVDNRKYYEVNEKIIDIVNRMGDDIVNNNKLLDFTEIFKKIAKKHPLGFVVALGIEMLGIDDMGDIAEITAKNLAKEKAMIKANRMAWTSLLVILNREKGNIELAFNGF